MESVKEFLESSTVHGLIYISTSRSKLVKLSWFLIVLVCFGIAGYLIGKAYADWDESPASSVITTHPVDTLQFPKERSQISQFAVHSMK